MGPFLHWVVAILLFLSAAVESHEKPSPWRNVWNATIEGPMLKTALALTTTSVVAAVQRLNFNCTVERFDPDSGKVLQVLENSGVHIGFGASVAAAGGYVAVGVSAAYDRVEAVMVYSVNSVTGSLSWAFNVTENLAGACYGCAIALTETHLVVGAQSMPVSSGALYVYSVPSGALLWSNFSAGSVKYLGAAVAANSRYLAVSGTWYELYSQGGIVWVMDIHTGDLVYKSSSGDADGFGNVLAMSETLLAVGAEYAPTGINPWTAGPGTVRLFSVDDGVKVLGDLSGENSYDMFGASLALCGNNLVVGAPNYGHQNPSPDYRSQGKVYYYNELLPLGDLSGGTASHYFGVNVVCNKERLYAFLREDPIDILVALEI